MLELVAHAEVVPDMAAEELLEGADGGAAGQSDRLGGLARQVREQAAAVGVQVLDGGLVADAVLEQAQIDGEGRAKGQQLYRVMTQYARRGVAGAVQIDQACPGAVAEEAAAAPRRL